MNFLFDPEDIFFLSYEQESDWKKKWLDLKIRILETKLNKLNSYFAQQPSKTEDASLECCSRTKPPPSSCSSQCVNLYPVYQQYSNLSKLISSSYAPITPVWKIDDDQKYNLLAPNESDSDSYFKDDHPIIYDFTKDDQPNTSINSNENQTSSLSTNQLHHDDTNDSFIVVPKFVRPKKDNHHLILTPGWTPCDPMVHFNSDSSSEVNNELDSFELRRKKAHFDIEIVQRRIQSHQLNIPIEESNIHDFNDPKIFPTNEEKKIEKKYKCRSYQNQVPPNWEPRTYDSPEDMLNEEEIDVWTKLMKNELSKEAINNDIIDNGLKLKHIQIRSVDNSSLESNSSDI